MDKQASMSGPEHFRAGEYKLQQASHLDPQMGEGDARLHAAQIAEAQAHFVAAQVMAFGAIAGMDSNDDAVADEWRALLGVKADSE